MHEELKALAELVQETAKSMGLDYLHVCYTDAGVVASTTLAESDEIDTYFLNKEGNFYKS